jgi:hypothetical protein
MDIERRRMNEQLRYNKNEEPMCIPKATMDRILKVGGKNIMCDAIALYVFYYHTAKWQGQTNAKCTVSYAANGLGITEERIRRAKALLIELGLVSEFTRKNESGQVIGWYVTVNFIQNHPTEKPQGGKSHKVENPETNALSTNRLNALSTNKEIQPPDGFDAFWKAYPRKVGKPNALKAYLKIKDKPSNLLDILEAHKRLPQWTKDNGQFIPHAATWLNGRRWEDELDAPESGKTFTILGR